MMLHMPYMKKTNDEFINWILTQHNGLDYGSEPNFMNTAEPYIHEAMAHNASQHMGLNKGRRAVL